MLVLPQRPYGKMSHQRVYLRYALSAAESDAMVRPFECPNQD